MMNNLIKILKGIFLSPGRTFRRISSLSLKWEAFFLFLAGVMLTFLKSFDIKAQRINFWTDSKANEILSFFSIPQVKWLMAYMSFILFLLMVKIACNIILKKCNLTDLFLYFASISGAGIILQILFLCLPLSFSREVTYILSYVAFIWILYLSILSIKISQETTFYKASIIYFVSALPVVVISGLPAVSPFLMWIS